MNLRKSPHLIALLSAILVTIIFVIFLFSVTFVANKLFDNQVKQRFLSFARAAGTFVTGDEHQKIVSQEQLASEIPQRIISNFEKIQKANPEIAHIYTFRQIDGKIYFVLYSPDIHKDHQKVPKVMEPYRNLTPTMEWTLKNRKPSVESEIYTDNWGSIISAYAPIIDSKGNVEGIVVVDIGADDYLLTKGNILWLPGIGILLGGILCSFVYFLVYKREVSRIKQLSEQQKYTSFINNIPAVFFRSTFSENWMMTYINDQVQILTGYPASDFINNKVRSFSSIIHPDYRDYLVEEIRHQLETQNSCKIEVIVICADQSVKWLMMEGTVIYAASGEPTSIEGFIQDITERKKEESLKNEALLEAERANNAKSEFLSSISHEIRTPMNGVLGTASLLYDTELTPKQEKYIKVILESGGVLLALINDLLDLSKIEAGKFHISEECFELRSALQSIRDLYEAPAHSKGLQLNFEYDSNLPQFIISDHGRWRQVVSNLIGNALKFTHEGSVTLKVERLTNPDNSPLIKCSVIDTGLGVPEKSKETLFEKFTQVESKTHMKEGGTGLGLAICKSIVEAMGGQIGLESVEGKGSTFWFTLPLIEGSADQQTNFMAHLDNLRQNKFKTYDAHILVAEDVETNRMIMSELLKKFGLTFDMAENGQIAKDLAAHNDYDLIFMDMRMPVMDGIEATHAIRSIHKAKHSYVPIVALTANAMSEHKSEARQAGMDDFLSKPVNIHALTAILEKWLLDDQMDSFSSTLEESEFSDNEITDINLIETSQLEELAAMIGADKLGPIIEEFKNEILTRLDKIKNGNLDNIEIANELHALTSCSGNLGMERLSALARKMMNQIESGKAKEALKSVNYLESLYQESLTALLDRIAINSN